jgi:tetratricopeptide (TPR) repeat protein
MMFRLLGLVLALAMPGGAAEISPDEKACRLKLQRIGKALAAYERDHKMLPDHLSALVPEYLADATALLCPADKANGDIGVNRHMKDPRLPSSYEYLFSTVMSNGLGGPLGTFPKPDVGNAWGTWRHVNTHQRTYFGPWVPLARCYHHRPAPDSTAPDRVLNLVPSGAVQGDVYVCGAEWESSNEAAAEALKRFARDVRTLGMEEARKKWYLARMLEHSGGWAGMLSIPENRKRMQDLAAAIIRSADEWKDEPANERDFKGFLYRLGGQFYVRTGDLERGLENGKRALATSHPRDRKTILFMLAEIYLQKKQDGDLMPILEELHREDPKNRYVLTRLAGVYERAGRTGEAVRLLDRADPTRSLLGKQAPDFDVPLLSGEKGTLKGLLRGKKALLVNFWYLR